MKTPSQSPIVTVACRAISPAIQLVALYVVFHGHYSPGGGVQGGVLLAASFLLIRLALGSKAGQLLLPTRIGVGVGAVGVLLYAFVGLASLATGGAYLDYGALPIPGMAQPALRSLGILLVEVGGAIAVAATITVIYDELIESERHA